MASEEILRNITLPASADLSANQYELASGTTAAQASLVATRGGTVLGVLQDNSTAQGIESKVGVGGVTKVVAGDSSGTANAIAFMGPLISSSAGRAVPSTQSIDDYVWGRALEPLAASSTGIIRALITHEGRGSSE